MNCTRCHASGPTVATITVDMAGYHAEHHLCRSCLAEHTMMLVTPGIDDPDLDVEWEPEHHLGCRCIECDPDWHMEMRRSA